MIFVSPSHRVCTSNNVLVENKNNVILLPANVFATNEFRRKKNVDNNINAASFHSSINSAWIVCTIILIFHLQMMCAEVALIILSVVFLSTFFLLSTLSLFYQIYKYHKKSSSQRSSLVISVEKHWKEKCRISKFDLYARNYSLFSKLNLLIFFFSTVTNNGRVCIDKRIGWSRCSQTFILTEKVTNFKY